MEGKKGEIRGGRNWHYIPAVVAAHTPSAAAAAAARAREASDGEEKEKTSGGVVDLPHPDGRSLSLREPRALVSLKTCSLPLPSLLFPAITLPLIDSILPSLFVYVSLSLHLGD